MINEYLPEMAFENILFVLLVTQQNKDAMRRLPLLTFISGLPKDLCMGPSYQKNADKINVGTDCSVFRSSYNNA